MRNPSLYSIYSNMAMNDLANEAMEGDANICGHQQLVAQHTRHASSSDHAAINEDIKIT